MKKKVLITGGAGFIGSQLGYRLSHEGYDVVLVDDMSFGRLDNLVIGGKTFGTLVVKDVRSPELFPLMKDVDCVFHFAGVVPITVCQEEPGYAMSVNVGGTANVLEAARRAGVRRVVFASTNAVYENTKNFPLREDDMVSPDLIYPASKVQGEKLFQTYAKVYGMETVIVRFFNIYGPHQDFERPFPYLTGYLARELLLGRAPVLHSDGTQERDYVYIDDVNDLLLECMASAKAIGETFNACSGATISVRKIYEIMSRAAGASVEPIYHDAGAFWDKYPALFEGKYPLPKELVAKEVTKYTLGTNEKAKNILAWEPKVSAEEGMARAVAYVKEAMTPELEARFRAMI